MLSVEYHKMQQLHSCVSITFIHTVDYLKYDITHSVWIAKFTPDIFPFPKLHALAPAALVLILTPESTEALLQTNKYFGLQHSAQFNFEHLI